MGLQAVFGAILGRLATLVAMRVYLASTSPARLMLLRSAGIEPIAIASEVDEDAALERFAASIGVTVAELSPQTVVLVLARAKAEAVAQTGVDPTDGAVIDGLVVGGDSMFELEGRVLGKPYEPDVARARWHDQLGKTGTLWSGHWVVDCRATGTGSVTEPGVLLGRDEAGNLAGSSQDPWWDTEPGSLLRASSGGHPAAGSVARAAVTFVDDVSDAELEAYIGTGEPLHVAGAFTVDSLAAPFISRVEGDPSTVVGMSLPTLRRMVRLLGVEWHELWNRVG